MNNFEGNKDRKKSQKNELPKVERESKKWILLPLTLLFGVPF